jgi:NADH-quinone oxidoreductase subunit I
MGYLLSTFQSLFATLRQALAKPTTVEFPKVKRERAPRIRASFALTRDAQGDENCIGCKKCEKICPSEVITVVASKRPSPVTGKARGYADDFTLNLQACIICELCVQVCPTDAIIMVKEQEAPGYSRADLTLTMDKLYKNGETKERWAWSNATVLAEHQKPAEEKRAAPAAKPPAPAASAPAGSVPAPAAAETQKEGS